MVSKEVDRQLLRTYLEGNYSGDQLRQIKEYLNDEAYRDSLNRFMHEEWESMNNGEFPALPEMPEQYARFRSYLATNNTAVQRPRVRRLYTVSAIAAAILLLIVGTWLFRALYNKHQSQQVAAREIYFHNEPGQRKEVQLPDSSRVYLGAASSLRYKQAENGSRLVLLEGQAYFVVKHDEQRPFTVITGSLTTVDVGTEFNIRHYPDDPSIEVIVSSGQVQVLNKGANTAIALLDAGQRLEYDTLTQRYGITTPDNADLAGAWRKGVLSFRRQRLKEVTDELQRYYGVRFQYTDPTAENILITTVLDNKSLDDALDIVTLTAGIRFTRQGNGIVLK